MRLAVTVLSPPFIEFCTALLRTSSSTRSNGDNWPTRRLPVSLSGTIRNAKTISARRTNSHQAD
jgi:hypothetical protein